MSRAAASLIVLGLIGYGAAIAALLFQRARWRDAEARHVAMLRALPDLMFVQSRDGVYLDFHSPDPDALLLPPEAFLGRNMRDVLPRPVLDVVEPLFEQVWNVDQPATGEYEIEIDGARRRYEVRVVRYNADRVLSIVRDITERARMQAALEESAKRYALATASGRAGVWDWNVEGDELYIDPQLKALLGYEDHEIRNSLSDWARHAHPDDVGPSGGRLRAYLNEETATFEDQHRMVHKDGSIRWFLTRGSIVREGGRPTRMIGTDTDITELKLAEEALHRAQLDLERMSRLAALGEFAASTAHEISQPLTAIIMNSRACLRWLEEQSPDLGEIRATLLEIVEASRHADAVIHRNRELFRHHTAERRPLDINDVIREVTMVAAARLRAARVRLDVVADRELPPVLGDAIALSQVLLNLVANAVDAMATTHPESRRLSIIATTDGARWLKVAVRDTGVGLANVDADRIFTAAYTTKPDGTGLGLSISRTIIEAHGGRIWATSNPEGGATFTFALPLQGAAC